MYNMYETINRLCKESGISVSELCRNIRVSRSTLSELKLGRTKSLSSEITAKISNYFNVSVDYLLGESDIKKPNTESKEIDDNDIKVALFGGDGEVTEEMWGEVKRFVAFVKEKRNENK